MLGYADGDVTRLKSRPQQLPCRQTKCHSPEASPTPTTKHPALSLTVIPLPHVPILVTLYLTLPSIVGIPLPQKFTPSHYQSSPAFGSLPPN